MERLCFTATESLSGTRLDVVLSSLNILPARSQAQKAIKDKRVTVNQINQRSSYKVIPGDVIEIQIPEPVPLGVSPENIPLDILFEDQWIIVVNKPAGMVVHPAHGNYSGTLVNALLHHCRTLSGIGGIIRPGIVHRLDKGTTGILVVAKNDMAHHSLSLQFKQHTVSRTYTVLVFGRPPGQRGTIRGIIGRDRVCRKKMSVKPKHGRQAVTHWEVAEVFAATSLLTVTLETGRTHQVRVHLASIGNSVVGDYVYGSRKRLRAVQSKQAYDTFQQVNRPLLHAGQLGFMHPAHGTQVSFKVALPDDFSRVLTTLRHCEGP